MDRTDEELVAEYLAGDEAAFAELTRRNLNGAYNFAYRLMGEGPAAEDVVQEAFVKAWKNLKKYDPKTSKFKTWLLRIVRNSAIDYLRKRKHVPFSAFETDEGNNILAETVASEDESVVLGLERIDDAKAVQEHLQKLSPKHREVLLLYYTNDATFEEIAEVLGEPTNTVKSRHRRALQALRELIAPQSLGSTYN